METNNPLWEKIKNYSNIIWDWNGTLVDDVQIVIKAVAPQLEKRNLPIPTIEQLRNEFSFPVKNYYLKLGFELKKDPYEQLASEFFKSYVQLSTKAPLFPGTKELLQKIKSESKKQAILSASKEDFLHQQVASHGITHFFDHIYGIADDLASSKLSRGIEFFNAVQWDATKTLFIGDTDHDLEVGQALGVDVLLIAQGHQSYERLSKIHAHVLKQRH